MEHPAPDPESITYQPELEVGAYIDLLEQLQQDREYWVDQVQVQGRSQAVGGLNRVVEAEHRLLDGLHEHDPAQEALVIDAALKHPSDKIRLVGVVRIAGVLRELPPVAVPLYNRAFADENGVLISLAYDGYLECASDPELDLPDHIQDQIDTLVEHYGVEEVALRQGRTSASREA